MDLWELEERRRGGGPGGVYYDGADNASTTVITPKMSSSTTWVSEPSENGGIVTQSSFYNATYLGWNAFGQSTGRWMTPLYTVTGWLAYQFPTPHLINKYYIQGQAGLDRNPGTWTFEGSNNGSSWDILDTQTGITGWVNGVFKLFTFVIEGGSTYTHFRLNVSATDGSIYYLNVQEIRLIEQAV